jgi:hypothetical protein
VELTLISSLSARYSRERVKREKQRRPASFLSGVCAGAGVGEEPGNRCAAVYRVDSSKLSPRFISYPLWMAMLWFAVAVVVQLRRSRLQGCFGEAARLFCSLFFVTGFGVVCSGGGGFWFFDLINGGVVFFGVWSRFSSRASDFVVGAGNLYLSCIFVSVQVRILFLRTFSGDDGFVRIALASSL